MSSYRGIDLFGAGPHRIVIGGVSQRHARHTTPGVDGERVAVMGRTARTIHQHGTLIADTVAGVELLSEAIEAAMTDEPGELIDERGRAWPNVLMLAFKPGEIVSVGPRLALDYAIDYVQLRG